jgi:uncharacterized repeat protein (TIGR03803 family)
LRAPRLQKRHLSRGGLIEDASGNLYGTTSAGGSGINGGTVFKLTPNGDGGYTESVLYSFCSQGGTSCTDGANPTASLIETLPAISMG